MTDEAIKRNLGLAFAVIRDALSGLERAREIESLAAGRTLVLRASDDPDQADAGHDLARRAKRRGEKVVEVEVERHIELHAAR